MHYDYIPGYIERPESKIIDTLSTMVPNNGTIVEIGSHFGKSAAMWGKFCHSSVNIVCIDHWDNSIDFNSHKIKILSDQLLVDNLPFSIDYCLLNRHEAFLAYTKEFKNISSIVSKSPPDNKIVSHLTNLDLVFLDGEQFNENQFDEIKFWFERLGSSGILCGDDYYTEKHTNLNFYSSHKKLAVDNLVLQNNLYLISNPLDTYMWIAFKDINQYNNFNNLNIQDNF